MSKSDVTLSNQILFCKDLSMAGDWVFAVLCWPQLGSRNFTDHYAFNFLYRRRIMGRTVGISIGGLILLLIVVAFVF